MTKPRTISGGRGTMMILTAEAGTCAVCATPHSAEMPHNYWSIPYQMAFKLRHGRYATDADAGAHLTAKQRTLYRRAVERMGKKWSEPDEGAPIAEPYQMSDGRTPMFTQGVGDMDTSESP